MKGFMAKMVIIWYHVLGKEGVHWRPNKRAYRQMDDILTSVPEKEAPTLTLFLHFRLPPLMGLPPDHREFDFLGDGEISNSSNANVLSD
jgi:hypothetical protein